MTSLHQVSAEAPTQDSRSLTKKAYIPSLDGLRAIAFLMVFGAHSSPNTISTFIPATLGVTIFFFLSGYLITTLLRGEVMKTATIALKDFYIRRALRIFMPMYVTLILITLLAKYVFFMPMGGWAGFLSVIFYYFNYARLILQEAAASAPGFDVVWSLGVEEHFYLLFPLIYLFFHRRKLSTATQGKVLLGMCVAGLCWRIYVLSFTHLVNLWTYYSTDCRFDSILWGCLLAVWTNPKFDTPPLWLRKYSGLLAAAGLALIFATLTSKSHYFRESFRYTLQGIGLYFIFYFAISSSKHWSVSWLENKALRYLGWVSYAMYLSHVFILDALRQSFPSIAGKDWLISPLGFALTLGYAFLMRRMVELPLQTLRGRFRHDASTPLRPTT